MFFAVVIAALMVSNLLADDVAALPGSNSNGTNVSVFEINPLDSISNFTAGDGAFVILPKPDGSKYYIISKSTTNSVMKVDMNFANPTLVTSFSNSTPTGAAITPDGTRLLVASGSLHVFDTTKDVELITGGYTPVGISTVTDVAVSLDGTKAYILGSSSAGGYQVNVFSLSADSSIGFASNSQIGPATGLTVGPNGLVYVSTQNQILELDPTTLKPTPNNGDIGVNALPGKLVFTPDGKYALAVNQTPQTLQTILLINLTATPHTVTGVATSLASNVVFDTLLVANSTTVFAYSSAQQSLYQLGIGAGGNITINGANIGAAPISFVSGVAISNEVQFNAVPVAHYLFVSTAAGAQQPGTLYRVDLTQGPTITAQNSLPVLTMNQQFGALDYIGLPSAGPAVDLLVYGNNQIVNPSTTSLPLVVRAVDGSGKPVTGVPVTFAASINSASVSPTSATTGSNGYAETILTAPSNSTSLTVTATAGKLQGEFTITVGTPTTTGGAKMAIVSGQGQIIAPETSTAEGLPYAPLTVAVTNISGGPASGVPVVFTIAPSATASGTGSLQPAAGFVPSAAAGGGLSINTNAQGLASINFLTTVPPAGLDYSQTAITAKAGANSVTFYETTFPSAGDDALSPKINFNTPSSNTILTGPAGSTLTGAMSFSATIVDASGIPIPNVSVHTCVPSENGSVGGVTQATCIAPAANSVPFGACVDTTGQGVLSDAHGNITCNVLLNGVVGNGEIGAQYGNAVQTHAFTLIITPGPPMVFVVVQGNNQTGKPGQQLPLALRVQLQDAFGNVLPDTPVSWTVSSSGVAATLQQTSSATDGSGSASTLVTLGQTAGTVVIQVAAGSASASFSLTVVDPAAGIQQVSGNNQVALVGAAFAAPLVVKVVDTNGNIVSGAPVTFTISSGSATLGSSSANTDTTGQASTTVTAGSNAGSIVVVASAGGSFTTTFNLTAQLPGPQNILFVNGAFFQVQPGCQPPGCVAPGEIVTVQGTGFASGVQGVVSGLSILGPLPTSLAGVSITFNGVAAPIFYVANVNGVQSLTIQVPFETAVGNTTVVLNGAGGGSGSFNIQTQLYAPGVFTSTYGNQTIAVAVRSNGTYASPINPVQPGETIYVFVDGLGQTSPAAATNTPGSGQLVTATVVTGLNNKGVPHTTVDYAPGLVGVYIIAVQVPENVQSGALIPFGLILTDPSGMVYHTNTTFLPIQ